MKTLPKNRVKLLFKGLWRTLLCLLVWNLCIVAADAQTGHENSLKFTKTVHNFGKISIDSGVQHCSFEFTNTGNRPVVIYNVISSCGCTEPKWPKKPVLPGEKGVIAVDFLNDQGPYPFDKNLTVYTSEGKRPILLRIFGIVYDKEKSVKELFPISIGSLNVMREDVHMGQIEQGLYKGGIISVANLTGKAVTLTFTGVDKGLELKAVPQTIQPGDVAEITYSVDTKEALHWGHTVYKAYFVCNGVKAVKPLSIEALIIDKVSNLTKEEMERGSMVMAKNSSVDMGAVNKGKKIEAFFNLRNIGAGELLIHKVETNGRTFDVEAPKSVKPGQEFTVKAVIDSGQLSGEEFFTITLITNSPKRPLVNLFISAIVE